MSDVDPHLNEVALQQLTWKPATSRNIAIAIVEAVMAAGCLFTDEVPLDFVEGADVNVIGASFKRLIKCEIVAQTGRYRRSTKEASHGRTVFEYRLASLRRAQTFLTRNGKVVVKAEQHELFTLPKGYP